MTCPSTEDLVALRLASAPLSAEHAALDAHVRACAACTARAGRLADALAALARGPLPLVDERWRQAALAAPASATRRREHTAELLVDTSVARPALALRGEALAARHLLYRAGRFRVDVALLEPDALVGHVLAISGPALATATCILAGRERGGAERVLQGDVLTNGDFRLEGVRAGTFELVLEDARERIVVADLELGSEREQRDG